MDKWRRKGKAATIVEDSLLPPTLRYRPEKRRTNKWSIDAFFKKVSSILDTQSSSSSLEDISQRQRRRVKGKSRSIARAATTCYVLSGKRAGDEEDEDELEEDLVNANMSQTLELLEARLNSGCSEGSLEGGSAGGRRLRRDKVKARVEALRDQLCVGDSSMDESSNEEVLRNGHPQESNGKRRSRASRTERYLKRNGLKLAAAPAKDESLKASRSREFQPIERVPRTHLPHDSTANGNIHTTGSCNNGVPNEMYARQSDIGVNPLVQQTLQYFSEFDRNMMAAMQSPSTHKPRKSHPGHMQRRTHKEEAPRVPPKPPSRDHRSRILVNGASIDKYQQMLRHVQRPPMLNQFDKENGSYASPRSSLHSPNTEVRNINEGRGFTESPTLTMHNRHTPTSPPRSPLRKPFKTTIDGNQSPLLDINKSEYVMHRSSAYLPPSLQNNDCENSNFVTRKRSDSEKRSSKNLEEALCELEEIYNSLQLGDEELLERAEKRTMEELHYKGLTASPIPYDREDSASRRKTWADSGKDEADIPDRLKDDMAYRRMHPKERPSSVDGQSFLTSISYLMTSPYPSRRYSNPKRKPRRKEPDVELDDVVFRSMQYANSTLKVADPQPPFGIPLGPITTAPESDYLHTNRTKAERARSPYIPSCEPDLVTDDLAFRNLRKDAQLSGGSRQPSPSFLSGGNSPRSPPLTFSAKKKRAVRSLSANLYGLINKPETRSPFDFEDFASFNTDSTFDDIFNDVPVKCISRRTSDPEVMGLGWQRSTWDRLDVNCNQNNTQESSQIEALQRKDNSSDVDTSSSSCDIVSLDKSVSLDKRMTLFNSDTSSRSSEVSSDVRTNLFNSDADYKEGSDNGSSKQQVEPVTEEEISVYKKLCQDLENLVQLTKGIDVEPTPSGPIALPPQKETIGESTSFSQLQEEMERPDLEEKVNKAEVDMPPIKREISTIIDSLKSLGDDSTHDESSCFEEDVKADTAEKEIESRKDVVTKDEESPKAITKETCDSVAGHKTKVEENVVKRVSEALEGEEEERKDRVDDNIFFRDVHLAKLSGDWKESTPNGNCTVNRRTSLTSTTDNALWEGMNKCNHKYNSMPAKTSSLLPFRLHGLKRKSNNRKSMCTIS